MKILLAGGGTAGHIHPALAIAACIRRHHPQAEFLFVGAKGRMEERLVPAAGYDIRLMDVRGFRRSFSPKSIAHNAVAAYRALTAGRVCKQILREFKPDIAIGTGGYICGPILRCAAKAGIPVFLHESNAFPGMTVKMLAPHAKAVLVATEAAKERMPKDTQVLVTGNPIRADFAALDKDQARKELGLDNRPVVFAVGGSLGARALNEAMRQVMLRNKQAGYPLQIIHGAGRGGYDAMMQWLEQNDVMPTPPTVQVRAFIEDMPQCMAAADVVISRCGAMTLSELPAAGKASVLIPSPYVADNHQYYNAMALADQGAAVCVEEKDLSGDGLWQLLCELTREGTRVQQMEEKSRALAILDADERIYNAIRSCLPV